MRVKIIYITFVCIAMLAGCAKETVEPEFFGSIEGSVINSETENGVSNVSIETTPATEAILTNADGSFQITDIPTGNYIIRATKPGFNSKSVNVLVREDRTSSAKILLEPDEEEGSSSEFLKAEVTSWFQTGPSDSSFVDVEYKVSNTSNSTKITEYEVYFDIFTSGETFLFEVSATELEPEENNIGTFEKFVRNTVVDSVIVSGIYTKE